MVLRYILHTAQFFLCDGILRTKLLCSLCEVGTVNPLIIMGIAVKLVVGLLILYLRVYHTDYCDNEDLGFYKKILTGQRSNIITESGGDVAQHVRDHTYEAHKRCVILT